MHDVNNTRVLEAFEKTIVCYCTSRVLQQPDVCDDGVLVAGEQHGWKLNICFLFPSAQLPQSQTFITHHMKHLSVLPGGEDHLGLQA